MTERRVQIQARDGVVTLSGMVDETAGLEELLGQAKGGKLVIDLGGVTFINSLGVRDWIRMQARATELKIQLELRRVAEVIVHQLNMIVATRGTAAITSFYAPYACDACGREESLLVDAVATGAQLAQLQPPAMTCPECGATMAFNDFPERYFSFLTAP